MVRRLEHNESRPHDSGADNSRAAAIKLLQEHLSAPPAHFTGIHPAADRAPAYEASTAPGSRHPQGKHEQGADAKITSKDSKAVDLLPAIIDARLSNDNFQLMKSVRGLSDDQVRISAERAQKTINEKLGKPSVRLGVDDQYIHIHFGHTDVSLPYSPETDAKYTPNTNDPKVRAKLLDQLGKGGRPEWQSELSKLSTSELAMFDAISRSDGPALRSAIMPFKDADELDKHFHNISNFARTVDLSNWATIVWSNDFNNVTVHNGTRLFFGKIPIETKR